jgi:hypothetical protein
MLRRVASAIARLIVRFLAGVNPEKSQNVSAYE